MDPYLEHPTLWQDFHSDLCAQIRTQLAPRLRPKYMARLATHFLADRPDEEEIQILYPDVGVIARAHGIVREAQPAYAEIGVMPAPVENAVTVRLQTKQVTIEIREVATHRLVTAIEVLSPVNKRVNSPGYLEYRRKREMLLLSDAHVLEIDLLRKGARVETLHPLPPAAYYVILSRGNRRPICEVWPIQLKDRLPVVPVPLLKPDPDVPLDLGAAVATVYDHAAYDLSVDYRRAPVPALAEADAQWLDEFLREKGLR
jgi:hypothetical protein